MPSTTIKGQNLRVFVTPPGTGQTPRCIAMATSAQFHIGTTLEDSSTKDSTGDWQEQEVTGLNWDASTESLVTLTDNGSNGEIPSDILSLIISKTQVTLTFDTTSGTNNRTGQNSALKMSGLAWVSDVSVSAANRQNSTLSVKFTGTGALTKSA